MNEVPSAVRIVAQQWIDAGQPVQPPIPWPRDRWLEDFPANTAALTRLPDRLDRATVREVGANAARSPEQAVDAYLAVMAWGFGDTVGYGRFRTGRILNGRADAPARLHAVALAVVNQGAIAGYRALATTSRLQFLGPSFGTKLLYFWQPATDRPRALIFDAFVAGWLERETDIRIDAVQWSVAAIRATWSRCTSGRPCSRSSPTNSRCASSGGRRRGGPATSGGKHDNSQTPG